MCLVKKERQNERKGEKKEAYSGIVRSKGKDNEAWTNTPNKRQC